MRIGGPLGSPLFLDEYYTEKECVWKTLLSW
jgi:hypothetical protein